MAVRIRLQRKGARHMPFYRIVAADSRSPRDGRFIEQLGYYDPLKEPAEIKVDTEKVMEWFRKGAKPSETVKSLFSRLGIMETWHHVSLGKSPEEIRQIQDEARKRAEAVAAMERRARESAGGEDDERTAAAPAKETSVTAPAEETSATAPAEEKSAAVPADETSAAAPADETGAAASASETTEAKEDAGSPAASGAEEEPATVASADTAQPAVDQSEEEKGVAAAPGNEDGQDSA